MGLAVYSSTSRMLQTTNATSRSFPRQLTQSPPTQHQLAFMNSTRPLDDSIIISEPIVDLHITIDGNSVSYK